MNESMNITIPENLVEIAKTTIPENYSLGDWIIIWTEFGLEVSQKASSRKEAVNIASHLKEAAIKFPYFNKQVSSCILGMTTIEQVKENIKLYNSEISNDFWKYLYDNELINRNSPLPL